MDKLSVQPTKKPTLAKRLESVYSWEEAINEMKLCNEKFFRPDLKEVFDKLHEIREDRCPYPVSKNSLYHLALSLTTQADSAHQVEFIFNFEVYESSYRIAEVPAFIRSACFSMMITKKNNPDSQINVPNKVSIRAGLLIDQVKKTDVLVFIDLFDLGANFKTDYYVQLATTLFDSGEINAAARVLIKRELYQHFDLLPILKKLGVKGKGNREHAIEILRFN